MTTSGIELLLRSADPEIAAQVRRRVTETRNAAEPPTTTDPPVDWPALAAEHLARPLPADECAALVARS
ncbi:MAG: hypothetical protein HOU01_12120, partial [Streptomycetaceae bacterium]|nr:hypothetical protein [Streptomycetaceae bacterium]